jgi:hypothetical protein
MCVNPSAICGEDTFFKAINARANNLMCGTYQNQLYDSIEKKNFFLFRQHIFFWFSSYVVQKRS